MDNTIKDQIRNLVYNAKTVQALEIFIQWANTSGSDLSNDLIGLKSQYSSLKRNENLGLISFSEANIKRAQISNGVLRILESAEHNIFSHINSSTTMPFPITDLRRFIIDYTKGVYLETGETFKIIFDWTERVIEDLTHTFPDNTDDYDEFVTPLKVKLRKAKSQLVKSLILGLIDDLNGFAEAQSDAAEESAVMNEREQLVFAIGTSTRDSVIQAIEALVQYKLKRELVGDKATAYRQEWEGDKSDYNKPLVALNKARKCNELKSKYSR